MTKTLFTYIVVAVLVGSFSTFVTGSILRNELAAVESTQQKIIDQQQVITDLERMALENHRIIKLMLAQEDEEHHLELARKK